MSTGPHGLVLDELRSHADNISVAILIFFEADHVTREESRRIENVCIKFNVNIKSVVIVIVEDICLYVLT